MLLRAAMSVRGGYSSRSWLVYQVLERIKDVEQGRGRGKFKQTINQANKGACKKMSINTTGELRKFLATMLLGVKNGDLDLDKASRITKMAGQINESFYAEIKVAKIRLEAGEAMTKLGDMPIGDSAA